MNGNRMIFITKLNKNIKGEVCPLWWRCFNLPSPIGISNYLKIFDVTFPIQGNNQKKFKCEKTKETFKCETIVKKNFKCDSLVKITFKCDKFANMSYIITSKQLANSQICAHEI